MYIYIDVKEVFKEVCVGSRQVPILWARQTDLYDAAQDPVGILSVQSILHMWKVEQQSIFLLFVTTFLSQSHWVVRMFLEENDAVPYAALRYTAAEARSCFPPFVAFQIDTDTGNQPCQPYASEGFQLVCKHNM